MPEKRIEKLFMAGEKKGLRNLFQDRNLQEEWCFREYCAVVAIDLEEERQQSRHRFWDDGMPAVQLMHNCDL